MPVEERPDARSKLSHLQSSIHDKWQRYEDVLGVYSTPGRNKFFGATDALWDMDDALRGVWNGLPSPQPVAKLAAYGTLQALLIQQDAASSLREIVLPHVKWAPHSDPQLKRIRVLRHRLSGHVAYAASSGRTASIINVDDPTMIAGTIYGLPSDEECDRFPREPIRDLIITNARALCPILGQVDDELNDPAVVFARLAPP